MKWLKSIFHRRSKCLDSSNPLHSFIVDCPPEKKLKVLKEIAKKASQDQMEMVRRYDEKFGKPVQL